ncbi:hypothetical protein Cantr_10135 [Candida viswanathii]|uniref:Uncharacterized protein n=1 Tax=Candida viswanathii TaxID=5486 RepID=A0A367YC11_9ASCO|nr:hypothetical protein Cantr_10135 [Candida viswanathii]
MNLSQVLQGIQFIAKKFKRSTLLKTGYVITYKYRQKHGAIGGKSQSEFLVEVSTTSSVYYYLIALKTLMSAQFCSLGLKILVPEIWSLKPITGPRLEAVDSPCVGGVAVRFQLTAANIHLNDPGGADFGLDDTPN